MRAGMEVAYVGFPMEALQQGNINVQRPIASVQKGSIVAISDYDMKDAGYINNHMIRHSIPATGGASGSPIFDQNGTVVALLNAGNIIMLSDLVVSEGRPGRSTAARAFRRDDQFWRPGRSVAGFALIYALSPPFLG